MECCKPEINFHHGCGHASGLWNDHRKHCKRNRSELLPTDLPLPDFVSWGNKGGLSVGRSCKKMIPSILYMPGNCDKCREGPKVASAHSLPKTVIKERRIFWMRIERESARLEVPLIEPQQIVVKRGRRARRL